MLSLNAHQLNVFLIAAETLNFTLAAQRLNMTQPSVSQHVQSLEDYFGIPLFVRVGRNIQLTDAGTALIPLAQEMLYLAIHMEESMASLKGDVYGHLVVGCSTVTGRYLLPKLLTSFHEEFPQVKATCKISSQVDALDMLKDGKIHLALASNPPLKQDIEAHKICNEVILLICHPKHPWANLSELLPEDLLKGEFILPEEGSETHTSIRKALAAKGIAITQLRTLVSLGSLEGIALSVQEGLGAGFAPEILVNRLVKEHVRQVSIIGVNIYHEIFACRNVRRPATAAQEAFWRLITNPENLVLKPIQDTKFVRTDIE